MKKNLINNLSKTALLAIFTFVVSAICISAATLAIAGNFDTETKVTASDGAAQDNFGYRVAISGDTAIIGSPRDDIGPNLNQGSAYVFIKSGTGWSFQQKLTASDGAGNSGFGFGVAISDDTLFVGGGGGQGSAYVFTRNGTTWSEQQKLTASDGASGDFFGGDGIAISGNTAIISSSGSNVAPRGGIGAAYIFVKNGTTWSEQAKLIGSESTAGGVFGNSVGISGDTAVVGNYLTNIGSSFAQGTAYVFVRNGTTWTQQQILTGSDSRAQDEFGSSVAISGETIVVGADLHRNTTNTNNLEGSAYVFVRSGTTWSQQQELIASDAAANDFFGKSVAISGDKVIVGADGDAVLTSSDNRGSAYVFTRNVTVWTQQQKLTGTNIPAQAAFGNSVSISGNSVIAGASNENIGSNSRQGSAYIYSAPVIVPITPLYDFDGDGKSDISVFRAMADPNLFDFAIRKSSDNGLLGYSWGLPGDKLAPGDYDGDGKTDIAVWREGSQSIFYILRSSDGQVVIDNFGITGDVITVGDWDGDGKDDVSVYRAGTQSVFYFRGSNNNPNGNTSSVPWGTTGDQPMRGDFDGDGIQDAAIFRPSNATWYIRNSSNGSARFASWGIASDKFVPADYDGDGKTDLAVFRPSNSTWYILQSSNNQPRYIQFGLSTDTLVPADYDGDGKVDVAVFRNGIWYLNQSMSGFSAQTYGQSGDTPIPNAYVNP